MDLSLRCNGLVSFPRRLVLANLRRARVRARASVRARVRLDLSDEKNNKNSGAGRRHGVRR